MKEIILKKAHMENFKRFKDETIEFGQRTSIFGQNYLGKSSIADLFSWVLFNKSSTGNVEGKHFHPRRYDENGVNIDYVDVVGEIVLLVDGVETKIRKVQKQKWVRHRGSENEVYEGDTTEYEWNDVPTTATNHKKKVAEIILEEVFLLLSNPAAFPSKSDKDQRKFLMEHVEKITDADVLANHPEFSSVIEAMGDLTLEELEAKNKKETDAYKEKEAELPTRIDQERKHIEEMDFSTIEAELASAEKELSENESKIEDTGKAYENLNALKTKKAELDGKKIKMVSEQNLENEKKKRTLQDAVDKAGSEFNEYFKENQTLDRELNDLKSQMERNKKELEECREQYKDEMSKEMDESTLICPTCGQELPEDKKEEIRAGFAEKKANAIKAINERGSRLSKKITEAEEKAASIEKRIEELKELKVTAQGKENKAKKVLDAFCNGPKEPTAELIALDEEIAKLESEIAAIDTSDADTLKETLKSERSEIQKRIDEFKSRLALKDVIEKSKETVKDLEAAMVQNTQNLANCERLKKEIEKFRTTKNQMLSDSVNKRFKLVTWELFEQQKNGGIKDVCVCMIHGSQYGENTTSSTERMMAGMDIINTLQEIYEVKAPIFLDDADLYNEWNIPDMDSQLIKLCVSEDKELRAEVQ